MKYILIAVAALTISCDLNVVSDAKLKSLEYQIEYERELGEALRSSLTNEKDSLVYILQKEIKVRQRLEDSLIWVNLPSIKCWESVSHRHECQHFGNYVPKED